MDLPDLIFTAVALSMDAFAVSVSKGLSVRHLLPRHSLLAGAYFGGFQALMPLLGFFLADSFAEHIKAFDHWIAFFLLALIGANMVREAFDKGEERQDASFGPGAMLPLALATSVDALATGVSFAVTGTDIWLAITVTGVITFLFSAAGVQVGNRFGLKYRAKAELIGGAILILMGIKILVEHLSG